MAIVDDSIWRYVLTDMHGGLSDTGAGIIMNCSNKQFSYNINASRSAQCTVNVDNPAVDFAFDNDCLMKVYRRNRFGNYNLFMVGDVLGVEENATQDTASVVITAADPYYRLQKRALGISVDSLGRGIPYMYGLDVDQITPVPQEIGLALLFTLNIDLNEVNDTGVVPGTSTGVTVSSYGPNYSVYFGDVIQQSCAVLGGPDFSLVPMEPSFNELTGDTSIATLNFYAHLGAIDPFTSAVFEYGMGKHNVQAYQRLKSKANAANNVISLPQGYPTVSAKGDGVIAVADAPSITAVTQLDYVMENDFSMTNASAATGGDAPIRQLLANQTLEVLKQAQQQITFTPSINPDLEFGTDYGMGDIVQVRAYDRATNTIRFNGTVRVYGINITADQNDAETTALTLIPSTVSGSGTIDF